ncbi:MAG: pantoate--beta-alanine ligase [Candidatus Omnitrophica bacterium]|nr:pantoate--beta-alanine ligase [Candidatus Omnitrophota bacterium]
MRMVTNVKSLRRLIADARKSKKTVGFVPTMGFLHEGHASLMRQSVKENDVTVLSIFVNPKQFGPKEDLKNYPRDIKKDEKLVKKENIDIIFYPSVDEIYPSGYLTNIEVSGLSDKLCGESRPGHFRGVATVVLKLLNMVAPDVMYLGQKDAQQAFIIRRMVADLNVPVKVAVMPTVREEDGLAMSSRNTYLSPEERTQAAVLYEALSQGRLNIKAGERSASKLVQVIRRKIEKQTSGIVDYIQCVDTQNLLPVSKIAGEVLIALAVKFGRARLIDNVIVNVND